MLVPPPLLPLYSLAPKAWLCLSPLPVKPADQALGHRLIFSIHRILSVPVNDGFAINNKQLFKTNFAAAKQNRCQRSLTAHRCSLQSTQAQHQTMLQRA
jgi:hypothetical protein